MTATSQVPGRRSGRGRVAAAWRSGPLSLPGFRLLTIGRFTSTIGDYCYAVTRPWLVLSGVFARSEVFAQRAAGHLP